MSSSQIYIAASIAVLAIIAIFIFVVFRRKEAQKLTPLASVAFGFVLTGLIFGDDRLIGYSLTGVGVVLAIVDMVKTLKKKE